MTKRLKAYCRRTILEAAREASPSGKRRTKESTEGAFRDAMHGTDSGWWNDLIYTAPMLDMARYYRNDIREAVCEYLAEVGQTPRDFADRDQEFTFGDVIIASRKGWTWEDYCGENGRDAETNARALLWGLRSAIEYLTGELAREYCPDL